MSYDYDAIVIGAGSAGLTTAIGLKKVGKSVLLIEKNQMGGDCTNTGCIPSKTLIHHARTYQIAASKAGVTDQLKYFHSGIFDAVRSKVKHIRDEEESDVLEKKFGIIVKKATASFEDAHTVKLEFTNGKTEVSRAKWIVIASGSRARDLNIPGLQPEYFLNNENLFKLKTNPKKLLIIGGGAIGCEMAEAMTSLGSSVTIVTRAERLLAREEPEISHLTEKIFEDQGINIIREAEITSVENQFAQVLQKSKNSKTHHKVRFDFVLVAIGRTPNIENLQLDKADIPFNKNGIHVDKHYRTHKKHIFAVGDVSSIAKFTHIAEDQARHVVKKILFPFYWAENTKPLPRVTYLKQEVASTGLNYKQALKKYGENGIVKIQVSYSSADRSKTDEAEEGVATLICWPINGKILGASFAGKNAGELISLATLAIQHHVSIYKLNSIIYPYPVLGQLYKKLSDQYIAYTATHWKKDFWIFLKLKIRYCFKSVLTTFLLVAVIFFFLLS